MDGLAGEDECGSLLEEAGRVGRGDICLGGFEFGCLKSIWKTDFWGGRLRIRGRRGVC